MTLTTEQPVADEVDAAPGGSRGAGRAVRGGLGWLGQVIAWLVILGALAVLVVAVLVPRLTGATAYTILTGSMRPGLPPGTLVVAKPTDPGRIRIGDVITFQLHSGQPEVATHRVVGLGMTTKGERLFTTRGDANGANDPAPVRAVQVRGVEWYSVPYLGRLNVYLNGEQRVIGRLVAAGALLGYAVVMFLGAVRDRCSTRKRVVATGQKGAP